MSDILCTICGEKASKRVIIKDASNTYKYKDVPRCEGCIKKAERMFKDVELKKLNQ